MFCCSSVLKQDLVCVAQVGLRCSVLLQQHLHDGDFVAFVAIEECFEGATWQDFIWNVSKAKSLIVYVKI